MYGIETRRTARYDTVDVRTRAWTYGRCVIGKPYFHLPSHSSCFSYFKVVLVELGQIEGFPQIWRTQIFRSFRRHLSIQVSFNSYNAHCYFPMHYTSILYIEETCIFYNSPVCTYCTWTMLFREKHCAKRVNQVRLVKWHACKIQTV